MGIQFHGIKQTNWRKQLSNLLINWAITLVDQHRQIKMICWSIQSPKIQHKKHSIHLNQIVNSLWNLVEHFDFTYEIRIWKEWQVTTICIFKSGLLCIVQSFSPFTMKASCSLELFKFTTHCMLMWSWLRSNKP